MSDEELWRYVRGDVARATDPVWIASPSSNGASERPIALVRVASPSALHVRFAPLVWYIGLWLLHVEIAGVRALAWWNELGCSVRSLPALFIQAVGLVDFAGTEAVLLLLMVLASLAMMEIEIERQHRRSS